MIGIDSIVYIAILVIAPLSLNSKYRKHAFLFLSVVTLVLSMKTPEALVLTFVWISFPFILKPYLKKGILVITILIGFLVLNQYTWIIPLTLPGTLKIFGLSYIVFRQIDYLFYEGTYNGNPMYYYSYVISFYTIIAGPIQRYEKFCDNLDNPSEALDDAEILEMINRIVNGFLKVFLISALLNNFSNSLFTQITGNKILILPFAFVNMAYIYFNFSGYCDVVIGFARFSRIKLPENFNKPYLAKDINDFWSRQHITLTQWITDYVFMPLNYFLMNRINLSLNMSQYISFFITFLVAGLWHGTTINYLVYGITQGIGVCLVKVYTSVLTKRLKTRKAVRNYRSKMYVKLGETLLTQAYIALSFMFIGFDMVGLIKEVVL